MRTPPMRVSVNTVRGWRRRMAERYLPETGTCCKLGAVAAGYVLLGGWPTAVLVALTLNSG